MRCEAAERELSARLDGERDPGLDEALGDHLGTCARCRAFESGARRVRVAARVQAAAPVPDLVPRIVDAIGPPGRLPRPERRWLPYAAAFVTGGLVASLLLGGLPALRRGPSPALATEIPHAVAAATTEVTSYRATFEIVERNFHPRVPERRFTADIEFRAPERFRASVVDRTAYPSVGWTRNDFVLAINEERWLLDAPRTCPREAQPGCGVVGRDVTTVIGRAPFEGDTSLPTDIVLPVQTLVDVGRVEVVEEATRLGRPAVVVQLAYLDAAPLFAYLHEAGTWRPFFPHDRVLLTLDRESWFPLAYEVRAASSVERPLWATRQSLPDEPPGTLLFRAEARSLGAGPDADWQAVPPLGPMASNHGFVDEPPSTIAARLGEEPPLPSELAGLRPYASGLLGDRFVFAYARGLAWLTLSGARDSGRAADPLASPVALEPGFGVYSPATSDHGRLLAIRDGHWNLVLETNLPRADLVAAASSIPIVGESFDLRQAMTLGDAIRSLPSLLVPRPAPTGYRLWRVSASKGTATLEYLRPGSELDGTGIRLYQSREADLPPPLDLEVLGVTVRGSPGRYSAERAELEWVEDGVYRSVRATAFDLAGLLRLADSLEPAA